MKPPIGLVPFFIHREQRFEDVKAAIDRYRKAGLPIPSEWQAEYESLYATVMRWRLNRTEWKALKNVPATQELPQEENDIAYRHFRSVELFARLLHESFIEEFMDQRK